MLAGLKEKFAYLTAQQHELDEALRSRGSEHQLPIDNAPRRDAEATLTQLSSEWERLRAALRGVNSSSVTRSASAGDAFVGSGALASAIASVSAVTSSQSPAASSSRLDRSTANATPTSSAAASAAAGAIAGAGAGQGGSIGTAGGAAAGASPLLSRANLESVHAALADIERWLSSLHENLRAKKLVVNRALLRIERNLLVDDDAQVPDEYQEILNRIQVYTV